MTNEQAIKQIKKEIECVLRANKCDRKCENCDLVSKDSDIIIALGMAIEALEKKENVNILPFPTAPYYIDYGGVGNWHCPKCHITLLKKDNYCKDCGLKLDWGDTTGTTKETLEKKENTNSENLIKPDILYYRGTPLHEYICKCGTYLNYKQEYCPYCKKKIDWSNIIK